MSYELRFSHSADAYLSRLDRRTQERMAQVLRRIAESPFGHDVCVPLDPNGLAERLERLGMREVVVETNPYPFKFVAKAGNTLGAQLTAPPPRANFPMASSAHGTSMVR